jgi:hypothetical protein
MSERTERLRRELDGLLSEWMYGDEGITLTRPTKAQRERVQKIAEEMPLDGLLQSIAVVCATALSEEILRQGLRPADYWQQDGLSEALLRRVQAALKDGDPTLRNVMRATIRGQG